MNKKVKVLVASLLVSATVLSSGFSLGVTVNQNSYLFPSVTITASAIPDGVPSTSPDDALKGALTSGGYNTVGSTSAVIDTSKKKYKVQGGDKYSYSQLVDADSPDTGYINADAFEDLQSGAKSDFLSDMNSVATDAIEQSDGVVTEETRQVWLSRVQNCPGVGTQLIAALLENTKPDYAKANSIYKPFSGLVGTALGLLSILLMALLGIVMALDLSYIGIPIFRNFVSGPESGGSGAGASGKSKPSFISWEAVSSVNEAESGGGSGGQSSDSGKTAVVLYFKKRVIMLIVLGVCLLYLVSGRIWALVAWILDLMSGIL